MPGLAQVKRREERKKMNIEGKKTKNKHRAGWWGQRETVVKKEQTTGTKEAQR